MKRVLFLLLILLVISGCTESISKKEAEKLVLDNREKLSQDIKNTLSEASANDMEKLVSDTILSMMESNINNYEISKSDSYQDENKNWHIFLLSKNEDELSEDIVYPNKSIKQDMEVIYDIKRDCENIVFYLESIEYIKEEQREEGNLACRKIYSIFISAFVGYSVPEDSFYDKYSVELENKPLASAILTDDIFPSELAGYPLISKSNDPEIHLVQYGNFEYGEEDFMILNNNSVFFSLEYKEDCSSENIKDFNYVGDDKYYFKAGPWDNPKFYVIWCNGKWKFTLVDYKGDNDKIIIEAFKELKY